MEPFTFEFNSKSISVTQVTGASDIYHIDVDQVFSGYISFNDGVFRTQPGCSLEDATFDVVQQEITSRQAS